MNLFMVSQYVSLMDLEPKSPAVWQWLKQPRPREYRLEPRESTQPPTPTDGSGMVTWETAVLIMSERSRSCLMEVAKTVRLRQ